MYVVLHVGNNIPHLLFYNSIIRCIMHYLLGLKNYLVLQLGRMLFCIALGRVSSILIYIFAVEKVTLAHKQHT